MEKAKFERLLNADSESEHLEFKEAKVQFSLENGKKSLFGYYVAIANEKGGNWSLASQIKFQEKLLVQMHFQI